MKEGREQRGIVCHLCHPGRKIYQMLKDGLFVRRDVQYGIQASGFYNSLWEVFLIPV